MPRVSIPSSLITFENAKSDKINFNDNFTVVTSQLMRDDGITP